MFKTKSLRHVLEGSIQDSGMACALFLQENGEPIATVSGAYEDPGVSTSPEAIAKVYSLFVSSAWKQLDQNPHTQYTCLETDRNRFALKKVPSTQYLLALVADVHIAEALVVRRLLETVEILQSMAVA